MKTKPAVPFSNGMSYEYFCENFCYRCSKGKINENGFPEYIENGGCPIWDAMEMARWGDEFPKQIVQILDDNDNVKYYEVCSAFETEDEELMKKYKKLFEDEE